MTKAQWFTRYWNAGFSFFGTGSDEKKVVTKWTKYQKTKPTTEELLQWLKSPINNVAIVTGEISNLIVFDVDTKNGADPSPFQNLGMYEVHTPSGGYHFYCLYDPVLKSTKHKKNPHSGILKAVDIQSNGALVFAPPSSFNGKGYTVVNDVPIGPIPETLLIQVLEALEPEKEDNDVRPYVAKPHHLAGLARPGDIYNALASWDDVLLPLGWSKVGRATQHGVQYWRRPGKKDGISASTNYKGYDLLFVYSTSTDLQQYKGYKKFVALAHLAHKGDYGECAKALVIQNINSTLARNTKAQ